MNSLPKTTASPTVRDIEKEKNDLLKLMIQQIPPDLMEQIDFFTRLAAPTTPKLHVWFSSNGTGNAHEE